LDWVGNGSEISAFSGLGLTGRSAEKMQLVYTCNFVSSINRQMRIAVSCSILMAGQLLFDMWVQLGVWVGWILGSQVHLAVSWVGSGQLFGGLGWAGSMKIDPP